jgi:hypothetical protein
LQHLLLQGRDHEPRHIQQAGLSSFFSWFLKKITLSDR